MTAEEKLELIKKMLCVHYEYGDTEACTTLLMIDTVVNFGEGEDE